MPVFEITDSGGRTLEIEGDRTPTELELNDIFGKVYPDVPRKAPPSMAPITAAPVTAPSETQVTQEIANAPKPYTGPDLTFQEFKDLTLEMLTSGPVKIPKIERKPDDAFAVAAAKDFVNEISGVPEFFSSPIGAGLLAATKGNPVAGRAVAGGFALTTLYDVYKDSIRTMPNLQGASASEVGGFAGRMIAKGLFATALSKHAIGGKAAVPGVVKAREMESPLLKAATEAEAAQMPATAEALRQKAAEEKVPEPTALTPQPISTEGPLSPAAEIGPGLSPPPEPAAPAAQPQEVNAEGIRSDTGLVGEPRNVTEEGQGNRGGNVEQAPPGQPQPVVSREGESAPLQGGVNAPGLAGGTQGEVRGEVGPVIPRQRAGQFELRLQPDSNDALIQSQKGTLTARAHYRQNPDGTYTVDEVTLFVSPGILDPRVGPRTTVTLNNPVTAKTLDEARTRAFQNVTDSLNQPDQSEGGVARGQETPEMQVAEPLVGMGAAVPGEFAKGQGSPTAMKFRQIDLERQKRGLEPLAKPESVADQFVMDKAMAEIDRDPSLPDRLVRELNEKPRPISDWENHVLLLRKIELRQELDRAARDAAQAYADGRTEDMELAKKRWDDWSNQLTALEKASRLSGTERGRSLRSLQIMANEDFSLAELETRRRMAKGGEPLTDSERAELVKISDEWQKTAQAATERARVAEQAKLEAETGRLLAEARSRELESQAGASQFEPGVIRIAERIVAALDREADIARKRLRERLKELGAGPDPAILYDLARVGASYIGHVGLDFARWSVKMAEEFRDVAETLKPYFKQIFEQSQKIADGKAKVYEGTGKADQIKKAVKKVGVQDAVEDISDKIRSKIEKDELAEITPLVQKLGRALVGKGITDRNALVDEIHRILQTIVPDITRRETMEAMSGYGKYKALTKDEISVQWRDVKGQLQQVLKLEDIEARQPLPKTGIERRVPSDTERRLIKQVNEAKKKYGVVVTDPARQLKSALDARKTAIRNRISDLEYEIRTRQRIVKDRTAPPTDPELDALIAERDRLKAEHEQIFNTKGLTDEHRLRLATAAAERAEKYWQERLANAKQGRFDAIKKKRIPLISPEIEAIRARIDATKAEIEHLRELANPKATPEQIALKSLKSRMRSEAAKLAEKIASNDYTKRKPTQVVLDEEAIRLKAKLQQLRNVFEHGQYRAERATWTKAERVLHGAEEAIDAARAIKTSFDLSAVLRQGAFFAFGHPIRAIRAMRDMFRSIRSEQDMLRVNEEIIARPNFQSGLYRQAKLYLADQFGRLGDREEAYMSHWSHKIPGVAASERAYVTFLNRLRADMFDLILDGLRSGEKPTVEEARAVAHFVNAATGRGELTQEYAVGLNRLFFSPRFVISRFQTLLGEPLIRGKGARMAIAKEYGRTLLGIGALYVLAQAAGFKVSFDPRSSDFGKIRIGRDVRLDPLAGT